MRDSSVVLCVAAALLFLVACGGAGGDGTDLRVEDVEATNRSNDNSNREANDSDNDNEGANDNSSPNENNNEGANDNHNDNAVRMFPAHCANDVLDGNETELNCGGDCAGCTAVGDRCRERDDCAAGLLCDTEGDQLCDLESCEDGNADANESDIDCGGDCATRCTVGQLCAEFDNSSLDLTPYDINCTDGAGRPTKCDPSDNRCDPPSCSDNILNGGEAGEDCGLIACGTTCENGESCLIREDCINDFFYLTEIGDSGPFEPVGDYASPRYELDFAPGEQAERDAFIESILEAECAVREAEQRAGNYTCDTELWVPFVVFEHDCDGVCIETPDARPRIHTCSLSPDPGQCPTDVWAVKDNTCRYRSGCDSQSEKIEGRRAFQCQVESTQSDSDGSPRSICVDVGFASQPPTERRTAEGCEGITRGSQDGKPLVVIPSTLDEGVSEADFERVLADINAVWPVPDTATRREVRNRYWADGHAFQVCGTTNVNSMTGNVLPPYNADTFDGFSRFFIIGRDSWDPDVLKIRFVQEYATQDEIDEFLYDYEDGERYDADFDRYISDYWAASPVPQENQWSCIVTLEGDGYLADQDPGSYFDNYCTYDP